MKKRLLSWLLLLAMLLSLLPAAAFAEGGTEAPPVCTCETACTAESRNTDCPVCGAEGARPEDCTRYTVEQVEGPEAASTPDLQLAGGEISVQAEHTHCICGGSVTAGNHTSHEDVTYTAWNGTDNIAYTNNIAYVYLTGNATISSDLIVDGRTLYLCLNGKRLSSSGKVKLKVRNNARLVLCDCQGGGSIKGVTSGWGGGCVYLYESTLDLFSGTLTGAKVKRGGGVALNDANCTLNLYGGSISGNTATQRGGGVYMLNGGAVNLYGGSISNNTASGTGTNGFGGGISLEAGSGSINLYGGAISNNTAKGVYGGGIYLNSAGTITITGGEISGNKLTNTGDGGGICLNKTGAKLEMSGGSIKNNSASVGGGIDFANGGTFTMSGGEISGNTSSGNGGGILIVENASVTMTITGGKISGNKAGSIGGGLLLKNSSSTLNLSGAPVIKDNTGAGKASNIYLPSGKTLNISSAISSGASIGVTTADTNYPVVFSNAYDENYTAYFLADDAANAHVEYNSDKKLQLAAGAQAQKYTVTVTTENSGTAQTAPASAAAGETVALTATPNDGYHFKAWEVLSGNVVITDNGFAMPAENVSHQGNF